MWLRAKFIVGSVQQLMAKPEGGEAWLHSLRSKPYAEAHAALCSLPGIGPKVAACICLFSLDKVGCRVQPGQGGVQGSGVQGKIKA